LFAGRAHVNVDDIRSLAQPTLRHRILTNYRAEAEGVTLTAIIEHLLDQVPSPV
jgi:MoxR-like ATPase